jgi:c-di-GMP-binding flagellar brake protein YcgR
MNGMPPIPANQPITVHLLLNGSRWQFDSIIRRTDVQVRLNESETVRGLSLQTPSFLSPSQRRADYRISLAKFDPIEVILTKPHADHPDACAWPGVWNAARIVDLSAGGMAVLLKRDQIRDAKHNELFYLFFSLPGVERSFEMLGAARHTRLVHDDSNLRLALAFSEWGSGTFRSDQSRIARFIVECQRSRLKPRKKRHG